ncbi:Mo-dependent nitrogenase C-terminal domain-containing protein [Leptolyngbya sp. GGD]|uniref:Mo-dependent nitrogenase C-terminal domain-containing protein n=1 Tax=Leptolyngbya sp. GGD TaxID=2997907 RepID=UPI00227CE3B1|nr:Mo-dependent nitrogenase C-terminal domain-containing protein [Leptolyngbya sp. GGD]MCY6488897.1 Mo-dependent nitrogenase C-terminal domain-containing protein [Leptolyngbya sp. GGD]
MLNFTSHRFIASLLQPIAAKLDAVEIRSPEAVHFFCRLIPSQCPFERDIRFFGRVLLHIPPMCKLNPFYEQLVGLRFKALCYLADVCGEDIAIYC